MLVGGLVLLAHRRVDLRRLLPGLGIGAAVAVAVVALPLWWQFAGPRSYGSIYHPPGGQRPRPLWARATRSLGADPWASAAVSMNRTEENSFFGIPLLLVALAVTVALWRRVAVRALAAVVLVALLALAGGGGHASAASPPASPARGRCSRSCPSSRTSSPPGSPSSRCRRSRPSSRSASTSCVASSPARPTTARPGSSRRPPRPRLVLLPVVPTPLVVDPRAPMPAFFEDGSWRDWVDEGGSVLAAPAPWVGDTRALEWQAEARWGFPVVAGYFVGPDTSPERMGQYGATPTQLTQWMAAITEADVAQRASDGEIEAFEADLRAGRVDAIVLPDARPEAPALLASLSDAFGEPAAHTGGVHVWDVRA